MKIKRIIFCALGLWMLIGSMLALCACSHSHTLASHAAKSATCKQNGSIAYWSCSDCGKNYADALAQKEIALSETVIPAAHTGGTEIRGEKAPTETEAGCTGDTHCSACGERLASGATYRSLVRLFVNGEAYETLYQVDTQTYTLPVFPISVGMHAAWYDAEGNAYTDAFSKGIRALPPTVSLYYRTYKMGYTPIFTAEQLRDISMSGSYYLVCDIDLGGEEWRPLGTEGNPFVGHFDGGGHTVSDFQITGAADHAGLFGYNEGTVERLGVRGFVIDPSHTEGYAGGLAGYNGGRIEGCYAEGTVKNSHLAGGLVGYNEMGVIKNCYAAGTVEKSHCAGGLVGTSGGRIENCYATARVDAYSAEAGYVSAAGGLVGTNGGEIKGCYATGDVSSAAGSRSVYAGGLVGKQSGNGIEDCYRYSGQCFAVTKNGTVIYEATNAEGEGKDIQTLQSASFLKETLGWSEAVWHLANGAHPALK